MAVQETDGRQTAMRIDMNSDMGESFGRWKLGDDEALLDVVSSANVACGFHAGDPSVMLRTLSYAASREVMVGAHVAYRDLAGFGRRYVDESPDELKADVMVPDRRIRRPRRRAYDERGDRRRPRTRPLL